MRLWLIAKSNIKKKKGNAFIQFFLILLATMLLYTGINVLGNISGYLDENYRQQSGADYVVNADDGCEQNIVSVLKDCEGFEFYESEDLLRTDSNRIKKVGSGDKADWMSFWYEKMDTERTISNFKILDQAEQRKENSILVPMYLKVAKHCKTGDKLMITFADHAYEFEIYGFIEDVMFSSPGNVSYYRCYVTDEMYDKLASEPAVTSGKIYNVRVEDGTDMSAFHMQFTKKIAEFSDSQHAGTQTIAGRDYPKMRTGDTMMMNLLMSLLTVFSIVIVLIAIVVMRFGVVSSMEENMTNIGMLEALGYTGRQLGLATVVEYMILTVIGVICGFLAAGVSANVVAGIVSESVGMQWRPKADPVALVISAGVVCLLILGAVLATSQKYKKITTLEALREGTEAHSFKKNHLPLESSFLGLHMSLGIKEMLHNKKQNVSMFVIVSLLTYASVLVLMMYYNFVADNHELIRLIGLEKPDIQITLDSGHLEHMEQEVCAAQEVECVAELGGINVVLCNKEKEVTMQADVWNDMSQLRLNTILEGRYPVKDNEISVTQPVANTLGVRLGNSIRIKSGNVEKSVLIVGITQQISRMGQGMAMPAALAESLCADYRPGYLNIYLKDGTDIEQVQKKWAKQYANEEHVEINNFDENYQSILGTFVGSIAALCMVMVIVTAAVVGLTVYLLVRMKLIRERKILGVYKALGYTTKQLIAQVTISFLPVVIGGVLLGGILSACSLNSAFALAMSSLGIKNCHMSVSIVLLLASAGALIVYALAVMFLATVRIRKVEPHRMIAE